MRRLVLLGISDSSRKRQRANITAQVSYTTRDMTQPAPFLSIPDADLPTPTADLPTTPQTPLRGRISPGSQVKKKTA
ncbi:hypothetical protein E2C01_043890 [Portunus trituberculatus]|uniref:Uncharacterized protein n=1 Tax=Portunus trituberculatus TaxID=210409 RepID=A0A5B7FYX3_PORTR|nr:hypothetical protein [Portunus trituberculatus]